MVSYHLRRSAIGARKKSKTRARLARAILTSPAREPITPYSRIDQAQNNPIKPVIEVAESIQALQPDSPIPMRSPTMARKKLPLVIPTVRLVGGNVLGNRGNGNEIQMNRHQPSAVMIAEVAAG